MSVHLSLRLSSAFILGMLGDIELKFKPYTQIYGHMISWNKINFYINSNKSKLIGYFWLT